MSAAWPLGRAARAAVLALSLLLALGLDLAGQLGHLAFVLPCTVFALLLLAAGWRQPAAAAHLAAGGAPPVRSPPSSLMPCEGETQWMAAPAAPLPGMMALLDAHAQCTAASPGLARWLDGDRDLMRGQNLAQMFGAAAADALAPQVAAALAGNMRRLRCPHLGPNDSERWLQVELQPLLDDYGLPMGCTLLAMDVTPEQRQLVTAMRNERRLRFMLDQVPAAVAYVDTDLCYRHINLGQARWLGLDHAEVVGLPLRDLVPTDTWATLAPALMAALRGQTAVAATAQAGEPAPCHHACELSADGKVLGVCSVQPLGAAAASAHGGQRPVKLRLGTAAPAQADFSEITRPMGLDADEPRTGAAAVTAAGAGLHTVQPREQSLRSVLREALDHAGLDRSDMAPELADLALRPLAEDVVHRLAPQAQARQLELCCRIDEFLPPLLQGDARRLHQVLSHLVANALRFTTDGEVLLDVQRQDEHTLRFLVRDSGPGLSPERQRDLFDALPQPPDAAGDLTPPQPPRQGLGLPLARRLVASMGGSMGVHSVPGDGASFWFTLPLLPARSGPLPPASSLAPRHVLVVDDNATCRELVAQHLTVHGLRCTLACGGSEALALLRQARTEGDPFELALIDTVMPGMDGLTLASLVRADPLLKAVRLVLVTTRQSRDELARAHQAGVAAYLDKPVRRHALLRAVAQALDERGNSDATQPPAPTGSRTGTGTGTNASGNAIASASASATANVDIGDGLPLVHARVLLADRPGPRRQRLQTLLQALGCDHALVADGEQALQRLRLEHFDLALVAAQLPLLSGAEVATAVRQRERDSGSRRRLPLVALGAVDEGAEGDAVDSAGTSRVTSAVTSAADSSAACRQAGIDDMLPWPLATAQLVAVLTHWLPPELVEQAAADAAYPMTA